jgi:hypothetical protein
MSHSSSSPTPVPDPAQTAVEILQCYRSQLEWTAPERTVYQCRDAYLQAHPGQELVSFTEGLRFLLERRYLKRLNDERLELTDAGRGWLTSQPENE